MFGDEEGEWNADFAHFPFVYNSERVPWIKRGADYKDTVKVGLFAIDGWTGGGHPYASFRSVLSAQDGED